MPAARKPFRVGNTISYRANQATITRFRLTKPRACAMCGVWMERGDLATDLYKVGVVCIPCRQAKNPKARTLEARTPWYARN